MPELRPWVGRMLERNNVRVRRLDGEQPNPRPVAEQPWYPGLVAAHRSIRAEWDRFVEGGGDLPLIDETLGARDQNQGSYWKMAVLVNQRRGVRPLDRIFPETVRAMIAIPELRAACWSVLGPGGWIPEHVGPNAGCLRMLVGVDTGGAVISVSGTDQPFRDGEAVLFDDTKPHAVTNPGPEPRVVILCDLIRPLGGMIGRRNVVVQRLQHEMTPALRHAARQSRAHFDVLNPEYGPEPPLPATSRR